MLNVANRYCIATRVQSPKLVVTVGTHRRQVRIAGGRRARDRGEHVSLSIRELHRHAVDSRLAGFLYAIPVQVVPDEISNRAARVLHFDQDVLYVLRGILSGSQQNAHRLARGRHEGGAGRHRQCHQVHRRGARVVDVGDAREDNPDCLLHVLHRPLLVVQDVVHLVPGRVIQARQVSGRHGVAGESAVGAVALQGRAPTRIIGSVRQIARGSRDLHLEEAGARGRRGGVRVGGLCRSGLNLAVRQGEIQAVQARPHGRGARESHRQGHRGQNHRLAYR